MDSVSSAADFFNLLIDRQGSGLGTERKRYFNSDWSRFDSEDPTGRKDVSNLYAYARQNPTSSIDLNGLGTPRIGAPWSMIRLGNAYRFFDENGNADFDIEIPGHHYEMEWHPWCNGVRHGPIGF